MRAGSHTFFGVRMSNKLIRLVSAPEMVERGVLP